MSVSGSDSPFGRGIRKLASEHGVVLSPAHAHILKIHRDLLETWGRRMNLTAIRDPEAIARRHFLEGLLAGVLLARSGAAGTLLDLGSGNGFPAIPIKVVLPAASPLILVESSSKRSGFLRALLRETGMKDGRVESRRVERGSDLSDLPCDIFTTRGVSPFDLLREGLPFLRPGGIALFFMRRADLAREVPRLPGSLRLDRESSLEGREAGMILLRKS